MKKVLAMILSILMLTTTLLPSLSAFAESGTIKDFTAISSLPEDYSYGTVFWTKDTKIEVLDGSNIYRRGTKPNGYGPHKGTVYAYGLKIGGVIKLRMTNCAVDKDGDICDVLLTVDNVKAMKWMKKRDDLGAWSFNSAKTNVNDFTRMSLEIGKWRDTNLALFWFNTNGANGNFQMKYVKSGTNTLANISKNVATIGDIDAMFKVNAETITATSGDDTFRGAEGFYISNNSNIYYDKNMTGHYYNNYTWSEGLSEVNWENSKGIRVPMIEGTTWGEWITQYSPNADPQDIQKNNTAVITTDIAKNSNRFKFTYTGYACGLCYAFVSPYAFNTPAPQKAATKTVVYENGTYNYKVSQYAPNNFYASSLNFISNASGRFKEFKLADKIDSNLTVGTPKVVNESGEDKTSWFDVTKNGNTVTASAKSAVLNHFDFYAHTYTLTIPVTVKKGAGLNLKTIPNQATSTTNTSTPVTKKTNTVETEIRFKLKTEIVNGTISSSADNIVRDTDKKVTFTPDNGYEVTSITVDGKSIPVKDEWKDGGEYDFTKFRADHEIKVVCTPVGSSILVRHIEEGTDNDLVSPETKTGSFGEKYETSSKTIKGFTLSKTPANANGTFTEGSQTVIYEYKRNPAKVITHFVDEDGTPIAEDVTKNGKYGDEYQTEPKTFDEYSLKEVQGEESGTMEGTKEVTYVYALKSSNVLVYYKTDTGKMLQDEADEIKGKVGENYTTEKKDFEHYTFKEVEGEASGKIKVDTTVVTYIYQANQAKVITHHVDEDGKPIHDDVVDNDKRIFDTYTTSQVTVPNYRIKTVPENASGTIESETVEVTYVYSLKEANVLVNYVTDTGKKLHDTIEIAGKIGDDYNTEQKTFKGYGFVKTEGDAVSGKMKDGTLTVTYIYKLNGALVTTHHIDEDGKPIHEDVVDDTKNMFDEYTTVPVDVTGYEIKTIPDNANGVINEETVDVTYVYKLKDTRVLVNYVTDTGKTLHDTIEIKGKVFDKYETEEKSFYGYRLAEVQGEKEGEMAVETKVVTYVYSLKDTAVDVKYVDEEGNEIADPVEIPGKVGDTYNTEEKEIYGYELKEVEGEPTGEMTEDVIEVIYIYKLKPARLIVHHVDTEGKPLAVPIESKGKVFDHYITESITTPGYQLLITPENAEGDLTEEDTIVTYVYDRIDSNVIVNYITEYGKTLAGSIELTGKIFDDYTTEEKEFELYELIEVPANAKGVFAEDTTVVDYVYRLKKGVVIVKYVDEEGNVLHEELILEGFVTTPWDTKAIDIEGYDLITKPDTANGEFKIEDGEVIFVYRKKKETPAPAPEKKVPQTGATTRNALIAVGSALVVLGAIAYLIIGKKKKNKEETK